ncbi:MAG TPA: hypothetical protein VE975_03235 [Actinomycetota bacterium]|jgi:hypothetical protein|nr:hypothetical protein [Actinomycetota bacterium]
MPLDDFLAGPPSGKDAGADSVRLYLRGQNLEQLGRTDEAAGLYEQAVAVGFDSTGPYDRLIHIYSGRALHADVVRVAEAAIENVRTHEDKKAWYERMRSEALKAQTTPPRAAPRRNPFKDNQEAGDR